MLSPANILMEQPQNLHLLWITIQYKVSTHISYSLLFQREQDLKKEPNIWVNEQSLAFFGGVCDFEVFLRGVILQPGKGQTFTSSWLWIKRSHHKMICASAQCSEQLQVPAGSQTASFSGSGPDFHGKYSAQQMVRKGARPTS